MNSSDTIIPQNAIQNVIPHKKLHVVPHQNSIPSIIIYDARTIAKLLTSWQKFAFFLKKKREQNIFLKGSPHENFKRIIESNASRKARQCKRHYPQNTQELKIDFSSGTADDKGLQALCLVFAKIFPKLWQLEVSFENNDFLTQRGLELFALAISRGLTHLKALSWDFTNLKRSTYINQDALMTLGSILLNGNNSLCRLTFKFSKNFNDQMLESLSKAIRRSHIKLQQLNLSFDQCPYITEKGFNILADSIAKGLPSLKSFRISFGIRFEDSNYNAYYASYMKETRRNYLKEKQTERNTMEKCLREKLKFIPKIEIHQWVEY